MRGLAGAEDLWEAQGWSFEPATVEKSGLGPGLSGRFGFQQGLIFQFGGVYMMSFSCFLKVFPGPQARFAAVGSLSVLNGSVISQLVISTVSCFLPLVSSFGFLKEPRIPTLVGRLRLGQVDSGAALRLRLRPLGRQQRRPPEAR